VLSPKEAAIMSQLQPVNPPVGVTQFINPHQETRLILKEKVMSITGDAFDIKIDPQNGEQPPQPMFKVDPSWITTKKSFHDANGNHLFDIKKDWSHLIHRTFKVVDPQGNKFLEVKNSFLGMFYEPWH
jgi:alkaline phosphatase D